jgi:hypothetical protein
MQMHHENQSEAAQTDGPKLPIASVAVSAGILSTKQRGARGKE